jgi:hypothetical protein
VLVRNAGGTDRRHYRWNGVRFAEVQQ